MQKINKPILRILAILALGIIMPLTSMANEDVYGGRGSSVWCRNCSTASYYEADYTYITNPLPSIKSISPSSSNVGVGTKIITITGSGFVPSSVARINSSNRPTTFIDSSHLLMQITGNDTYAYMNSGGFYITVFNGAPGGGYSNGIFFVINKINNTNNTAYYGGNTNNQNNYPTYNFTDTFQPITPENPNGDNSNLAANAIGAGGAYPSSLIQWVFFAIMIMLIIILARKVYGAQRKYFSTPLKHD